MPDSGKFRHVFVISLRSWRRLGRCAEARSRSATSSAVNPAVLVPATPTPATVRISVSRGESGGEPNLASWLPRRPNWCAVRSRPANSSDVKWRLSGRLASNGPMPNSKVRRPLPRPPKKGAPNSAGSRSRPRSRSPLRSAALAELDFEALEVALRQLTLRLAAHAIEQRLNADLSDEASAILCPCGNRE